MATIAQDTQTTHRLFYVYMAASFIVIAFGGFVMTYWSPLVGGRFHADPVIHLHGLLFSAWTLFFFAQTALVASGRTYNHRGWGMAGISLATAMVFSAVIVATHSMNVADTIGVGDAARRFSVVPLSSAVLFGVIIAAAIVNVRSPERHKRLMLLATVAILQAPMGRVLRPIIAPDAVGSPPVFATVPAGLLIDLLIVIAMVYDWKTRGKPHRIYLFGLPVIIAVQLLRVPISETASWMTIASWAQHLGG
jgi:hypothetical protein